MSPAPIPGVAMPPLAVLAQMTPRQRDELLAAAYRQGRRAATGADEVLDDLRERLVAAQRKALREQDRAAKARKRAAALRAERDELLATIRRLSGGLSDEAQQAVVLAEAERQLLPLIGMEADDVLAARRAAVAS